MDIIIATLLGHVLFVDLLLARARRRRLAAGAVIAVLLLIVALRLSSSLGAQKTVSRLLMPSGVLLQLLWLAAVWDVYRRAWSRAALAFATLLLFAGAGAKAVGAQLVGALEAELPALGGTASSTAALDAVFVLGGGTHRAQTGQIELGRAGDRVRLAAALYHAGRTPRLVAAGRSFTDGRDLAAETVTLWLQMRVPRDAILTLSKPVNTSQEMKALATLAQAEGWTRVGVVSSAWHLPRAMALARRAGLTGIVPLAANHLMDPVGPPPARDWLPTAAGFRQSEVWTWERLGRAVGR